MPTSEQLMQKLVDDEKKNKSLFSKKKLSNRSIFCVYLSNACRTLTRIPGVHNLQGLLIRKHSLQKKRVVKKRGYVGPASIKKTEYMRVRPPYLRFRSAAAAPLR